MACPACTALINRWLDTTPGQMFPGVAITAGTTAYDISPAGVTANRRGRYERWRALVRDQTAAVRAACARGQHAEP